MPTLESITLSANEEVSYRRPPLPPPMNFSASSPDALVPSQQPQETPPDHQAVPERQAAAVDGVDPSNKKPGLADSTNSASADVAKASFTSPLPKSLHLINPFPPSMNKQSASAVPDPCSNALESFQSMKVLLVPLFEQPSSSQCLNSSVNTWRTNAPADLPPTTDTILVKDPKDPNATSLDQKDVVKLIVMLPLRQQLHFKNFHTKFCRP